MTKSIPLVDMRDFNAGGKRRQKFVQGFGDALRFFGFVRLKGHGVPDELIESVYDALRDLFSHSDEVLKAYHDPALHGATGYTPYGKETGVGYKHGDAKRFWHVCRESEQANVWPAPKLAPSLKGSAKLLYRELDTVYIALAKALEEYLGLEPGSVTGLVDGENNSTLRLLHYPPLPKSKAKRNHKGKQSLRRAPRSQVVRAGAHRDINWLTLLPAATASGLQVRTVKKRWLAIKAKKGEIIVNSGIMLERFTNGFITATEHQVVNPGGSIPNTDRFSLPFFGHPRRLAVLRVPKQFRGKGWPRAPRAITAGQALAEVLKAINLAA